MLAKNSPSSYKIFETIDDILTDVLIDRLFLWFHTFKLNPDYNIVDIPSDVIHSIIKKNVIEEVNLDQACKELLSHAKRYLQMYQANSGYEIAETKRYFGSSKREACVVATKDFKEGDELRLCTGALVPLTKEEDNKLDGGRDFSIIWSQRKDVMCLLLGPARFVNHDCKPNTTFIASGQSEISFKFTRSVKVGEELTSYYDDDYFGEGNCECLCATCERLVKGGYKPELAILDEENIGSINKIVYDYGVGKIVRRSARNRTNLVQDETPVVKREISMPRFKMNDVTSNHRDEVNLIGIDIDNDVPKTDAEDNNSNYAAMMLLSDITTNNVAVTSSSTFDQGSNYNNIIHRIPKNVFSAHSSTLLRRMGIMNLQQVNKDLNTKTVYHFNNKPNTKKSNLKFAISPGTISTEIETGSSSILESVNIVNKNAESNSCNGSQTISWPFVRVLNGDQILVKKAHGTDQSNSSKNIISNTDAPTTNVTAAVDFVNAAIIAVDNDNDKAAKIIRRWCKICDDMFTSSKNTMRCLRCTRHLKLFALDWPCRRLKRSRKDDSQKTTNKADGSASRAVKKFKTDITTDQDQISGTNRTDWSPYPIKGIDVKIIQYKRANGRISHAYEYCYDNIYVRWDKESGFVHLNTLKSYFNNTLRNLEKLKCWDQAWSTRRHIIIGGNIKYQGTWLPYDLTKKVVIESIGKNEAFLIPLFGPNYGQGN
ncbi:16388_t:CDS:2 [Entrophospora sp. SA101]|nr:6137_t:CDS:2 [Entrophospora sp. SA101]CAJ0756530.1 16388_t:CDS:2 [Entrophospora sp. SA101]CAJ0858390.1 6844_t:CDS:2 [Entrophospora sp. SA101]CAJ0927576.1 8621_t:CDS:2 [Entrophospora sp. SA101]